MIHKMPRPLTVALIATGYASTLALALHRDRSRRLRRAEKKAAAKEAADAADARKQHRASAADSLEGTEILLVRHGETVWNVEGRVQGSSDSPLTERGIDSAKELARRLRRSGKRPIAAIYSSPIPRARRTAELLAGGLPDAPAIVDHAPLRERSFGCLEGLSAAEQEQRHPEVRRRDRAREDEYAPPGGGESRRQVRERATEALLWIAQRHPGQRVLVVTHSYLMSSTVAGILRIDVSANTQLKPLAMPNAALNLLRWSGDGWSLALWADTGEFAAGHRREEQRPVDAAAARATSLLMAAAAGATAAALLLSRSSLAGAAAVRIALPVSIRFVL